MVKRFEGGPNHRIIIFFVFNVQNKSAENGKKKIAPAAQKKKQFFFPEKVDFPYNNIKIFAFQYKKIKNYMVNVPRGVRATRQGSKNLKTPNHRIFFIFFPTETRKFLCCYRGNRLFWRKKKCFFFAPQARFFFLSFSGRFFF